MIDLAAVESLVAVERCGSVGGAAAELGFTPSAVSQQVKRLERQVGATLLERAGRGVVLTAAGRRLVDEGRVLGEQVERLRSRLQGDAGRPSGLLRLAAFSTAVRGVVPPLVGRAAAQRAPTSTSWCTRPSRGMPWRRWRPGAPTSRSCTAGRACASTCRRRCAGSRCSPTSPTCSCTATTRWPAATTSCPADLLDHVVGVDARGHHLPRVVRPHVPRHPAHARGWPTAASSSPRRSSWSPTGSRWRSCPGSGRGRLPDAVVAVPVRDPEPTRRVDVHWRASMTDSPAVAAVRAALRGLPRGLGRWSVAPSRSARW